jgi:hypothetical protein
MKRLTIGLTLTIATCAALVVAQNKTGVSFKSKSGDFEISNISDQVFELDAKTSAIDFEFDGKPLTGRSDSQKLSFTAAKAKGQIRNGKSGSMYLLSTTLSGGVTIRQNPGTSEEVSVVSASMSLKEAPNRAAASLNFSSAVTLTAKDPNTTLTANSGVITLSGPANGNRQLDQVTLKGSVNVTANNNGVTKLTTTGLLLNQRTSTSVFQFNNSFTVTNTAKDNNGRPRTVKFTGTSGSVTIPNITQKSNSRPISSASIRGRVKIDFDGTDKQGQPIDLHAEGDRLTMDSQGEILLIGNVKITGGGLDYQSDGESQTIYILVDNDMKPLKYGARGNPTKVNIRPGGGGK